jgi:DNA-directed RNA polymerases I, II, and III subunit RPABC5
MLIVVRCMSCGKVLADKWNYYEKKCQELDMDESAKKPELSNKNMDEKTRGELLDKLGLKRICCRRHFLGCVDMMDLI